MSDLKIFAVTGCPIFHSRSPEIFNGFFRALGINAIYTRLAAISAQEALATAKSMKIEGLNVTSPFKIKILQHIDQLDDEALKIQSANCLHFQGNKWSGYNTDSAGVIGALKANGIHPNGKNVVVLGAGGAARAAAYGLIRAGAERVTFLNRTDERAKEASRQLGCFYAPLMEADKILEKAQILISCVPSYEIFSKSVFPKKGLVVLDANYRDPFLAQEVKSKEGQIIDGLDWLFFQALPAFQIFSGQSVPDGLQKDLRLSFMKKKGVRKFNIALIGFMGSGKTTTGRLLAEKLNLDFIDTDRLIEESTGLLIREIFEREGEDFFRKVEKATIAKIAPSLRNKVYSFGGGAILDKDNCQMIKSSCHVVWLWVSSKSALKRVNFRARPLLNRENPEGVAEKYLNARIPFYARASDLVISTEDIGQEELAKRIQDEIGKTF